MQLQLHNNNYPQLFNAILATILMPSVVFAGVTGFKVLEVIGIVGKLKSFVHKFSKDTDASVEEEPHRLSNPTQYTPLLPWKQEFCFLINNSTYIGHVIAKRGN